MDAPSRSGTRGLAERLRFAPVPPPAAPATRWPSIDLLRGISVAGMILVNSAGSYDFVYAPLAHAAWDGLHFADLVFPSFVFVMGVSLAVALGSAQERGRPRPELARKIVRRTLILIALGLLLNGIPWFPLASWRIPGVLQRIGLAYAAAALILVYAPRVRAQALAAILLIVVYEALLEFVPVPGAGAGLRTPTGNLGAWLDRGCFGEHLFAPGWDPEGLLGTLPTIASALLGVLAGRWLRAGNLPRRESTGLVAAGAGLALTGWLISAAIPINKALWSVSFVLVTAGLGFALLGLLHVAADGRRTPAVARPFLWLGRNALVIYVLSSALTNLLLRVSVAGPGGGEVALQERLFAAFLAVLSPPALASLAFALFVLVFWTAIAGLFHRVGFFVKI